MSPRRNVVADADPVADRSPEMVPVVVIGVGSPPVMLTKVPFEVATLVTPDPPPPPPFVVHDKTPLPSVVKT